MEGERQEGRGAEDWRWDDVRQEVEERIGGQVSSSGNCHVWPPSAGPPAGDASSHTHSHTAHCSLTRFFTPPYLLFIYLFCILRFLCSCMCVEQTFTLLVMVIVMVGQIHLILKGHGGILLFFNQIFLCHFPLLTKEQKNLYSKLSYKGRSRTMLLMMSMQNIKNVFF